MNTFHVVGAGPTGMAIAWELLKKGHTVNIYDKKSSAGGSWWEPSFNYRDMHAYRILFKNCYINTRELFKEMNIDWDLLFKKSDDDETYSFILSKLKFQDYISLSSLAFRVLLNPEKYKKISLKDSISGLSKSGENLVSNLPINMDGVYWDRMSAYEFVKSFDYVGLSGAPYIQRGSGKLMNMLMQISLEEKGAKFFFNKKLIDVEYGKDTYLAKFSDQTIINNEGQLVLCLDNGPASNIVKDNWGPHVKQQLLETAYSSVSLIFYFDEKIKIPTDLKICSETEWHILASVLEDGKSICCVMSYLNEDMMTSPEDILIQKVWKQIKKYNLPNYKNVKMCWGPEWDGKRWQLNQTSGVLSLSGKQVPFYGDCSRVALCGMMSERDVPFSSLEASVEIAKRFCGSKVLKNMLLTELIFIIIGLSILLLILIRKRSE